MTARDRTVTTPMHPTRYDPDMTQTATTQDDATQDDWEELPALQRGGPGFADPGGRRGPMKLRIQLIGVGNPRPFGILSAAARDHLFSQGFGWVRVERSRSDPRQIRLIGLTEHLTGALAIRGTRAGSYTISGARLLRLAPPGTDIPLRAEGNALVGRIPDEVDLPA